jgi:hypothetical protein
MLARSSTIVHKASGVSVETPLLIPSFSSKGFSGDGAKPTRKGRGGSGSSEVRQILGTAAEFLTTAYLISAFDIAKGHLPKAVDLPSKPDLIVVDSGGYEVSGDYDFSEVFRSPLPEQAWESDELVSVLDDWPAEIPAIFVSYDHPKKRRSFDDQVADARKLFRGRTNQLSCFLLKPTTKRQSSLKEALGAAIASPESLTSFDIVGITEKELAASPLERMVAIARLRHSLDSINCHSPIHVFGSLDPLSVCLYTVAGAEIFDGLTWLRYAFVDDQCVYPHSHATQKYGLETKDTSRRLRMITDNYYYLMELQGKLRHFARTGDFSLLPHAKFVQEAYSWLESKL